MPCGHTKTGAIIKEALSPHFQSNLVTNLSNPFSIMIDESNDKVNKSCIILVRLLDPEIGNVCTRFLADLSIKAGITALPINIDQLFIDIFYHFYNSSKRHQEFADHWYSLFTSEPKSILKHCPTRWLSLLHCVGRYLAQYEGLNHIFSLAMNRVLK